MSQIDSGYANDTTYDNYTSDTTYTTFYGYGNYTDPNFLGIRIKEGPIPYIFILVLFIGMLVLYYFMNWYNQNCATAISFLINFVLQKSSSDPVQFKMRKFSLQILAGSFGIEGLNIMTSDLNITILKFDLTYDWSSFLVRDADSVKNKPEKKANQVDKVVELPFRLTVNLSGVEITASQNIKRWKAIEKILTGGCPEETPPSPKLDPDILFPIINEVSSFYKWIPVTQIIIEKFCLITGNILLPSFVNIQFDQATLLHTTDKSRNTDQSLKFCCYQNFTQGNLKNFKISFFKNNSYRLASELEDIQKQLYETNQRDLLKKVIFEQQEATNEIEKDAKQALGFDPALFFQRNTEQTLIECKEVYLSYVFDTPTILTNEDELRQKQKKEKHQYDALNEEPITTITLDFKSHPMISYGPWFDNQRGLIMSYFMPGSFRNQKIYSVTPGEYRLSRYQIIKILFSDGGSLRIPHRCWKDIEPRKFEGKINIATDAPDTHVIKLTFAPDSELKLTMLGWASPDDKQTQTALVALFKRATLSTLLIDPTSDKAGKSTNKPLIDKCDFSIEGTLNYPLAWNALYDWSFKFGFQPCLGESSVKIFLLKEHLKTFGDLGGDWNSYKEPANDPAIWKKIGSGDDRLYFYPMKYTFNVDISYIDVILNVNENNIINTPDINDEKTNSHIHLRSPQLTASIEMPNFDFARMYSLFLFDVKLRNVELVLSLPTNHPMHDLLDGQKNKQIMTINNIGVVGKMMGHYVPDRNIRDSTVMDINIEGTEIFAFGHYIHAILCLKNNYFGANPIYISPEEYLNCGNVNLLNFFRTIQYEKCKYPQINTKNSYESGMAITLTNNTVHLPQNMYCHGSNAPKLRFYSLQLDLRSCNDYSNMNLDLSPLTVTIPLLASMNERSDDVGTGPGRKANKLSWNTKETYINAGKLSYNSNSSYCRPLGEVICTYRNSQTIHIDDVHVQLLPAHLTIFSNCLRNFTQQMADARDLRYPVARSQLEMENLLATSDNQVYKFLDKKEEFKENTKLDYVKLWIAAYKKDSFANNSMEVFVGELGVNLLHQGRDLSLTNFSLGRGLHYISSSIVSTSSRSNQKIDIPALKLQYVSRRNAASTVSQQDRFEDKGMWVSLAEIDCADGISMFHLEALQDQSAMREQADFIYGHSSRSDDADNMHQKPWYEINARRVPFTPGDDLPTQLPTARYPAFCPSFPNLPESGLQEANILNEGNEFANSSKPDEPRIASDTESRTPGLELSKLNKKLQGKKVQYHFKKKKYSRLDIDDLSAADNISSTQMQFSVGETHDFERANSSQKGSLTSERKHAANHPDHEEDVFKDVNVSRFPLSEFLPPADSDEEFNDNFGSFPQLNPEKSLEVRFENPSSEVRFDNSNDSNDIGSESSYNDIADRVPLPNSYLYVPRFRVCEFSHAFVTNSNRNTGEAYGISSTTRSTHISPYLDDSTLAGGLEGAFLTLPFVEFEDHPRDPQTSGLPEPIYVKHEKIKHAKENTTEAEDLQLAHKTTVRIHDRIGMRFTPDFIDEIDVYIELVQPQAVSVEDVLDEIHHQFSMVFSQATAPAKVADAEIETQFSMFIPCFQAQLVQNEYSKEKMPNEAHTKEKVMKLPFSTVIEIRSFLLLNKVSFPEQKTVDTEVIVSFSSLKLYGHIVESAMKGRTYKLGGFTPSDLYIPQEQLDTKFFSGSNSFSQVFLTYRMDGSSLRLSLSKRKARSASALKEQKHFVSPADSRKSLFKPVSQMPAPLYKIKSTTTKERKVALADDCNLSHSVLPANYGNNNELGESKTISISIKNIELSMSNCSPMFLSRMAHEWSDASARIKLPAVLNESQGLGESMGTFTGPGTSLRHARWQEVLRFALEHMSSQSMGVVGSKGLIEKDLKRLLIWVHCRAEKAAFGKADLTILQNNLLESVEEMNLNSLEDKNYVDSCCAPLTITLRKLSGLSPELKRRLQSQLHRVTKPRPFDYFQFEGRSFSTAKIDLGRSDRSSHFTAHIMFVLLSTQATCLVPLNLALAPLMVSISKENLLQNFKASEGKRRNSANSNPHKKDRSYFQVNAKLDSFSFCILDMDSTHQLNEHTLHVSKMILEGDVNTKSSETDPESAPQPARRSPASLSETSVDPTRFWWNKFKGRENYSARAKIIKHQHEMCIRADTEMFTFKTGPRLLRFYRAFMSALDAQSNGYSKGQTLGSVDVSSSLEKSTRLKRDMHPEDSETFLDETSERGLSSDTYSIYCSSVTQKFDLTILCPDAGLLTIRGEMFKVSLGNTALNSDNLEATASSHKPVDSLRSTPSKPPFEGKFLPPYAHLSPSPKFPNDELNKHVENSESRGSQDENSRRNSDENESSQAQEEPDGVRVPHAGEQVSATGAALPAVDDTAASQRLEGSAARNGHTEPVRDALDGENTAIRKDLYFGNINLAEFKVLLLAEKALSLDVKSSNRVARLTVLTLSGEQVNINTSMLDEASLRSNQVNKRFINVAFCSNAQFLQVPLQMLENVELDDFVSSWIAELNDSPARPAAGPSSAKDMDESVGPAGPALIINASIHLDTIELQVTPTDSALIIYKLDFLWLRLLRPESSGNVEARNDVTFIFSRPNDWGQTDKEKKNKTNWVAHRSHYLSLQTFVTKNNAKTGRGREKQHGFEQKIMLPSLIGKVTALKDKKTDKKFASEALMEEDPERNESKSPPWQITGTVAVSAMNNRINEDDFAKLTTMQSIATKEITKFFTKVSSMKSMAPSGTPAGVQSAVKEKKTENTSDTESLRTNRKLKKKKSSSLTTFTVKVDLILHQIALVAGLAHRDQHYMGSGVQDPLLTVDSGEMLLRLEYNPDQIESSETGERPLSAINATEASYRFSPSPRSSDHDDLTEGAGGASVGEDTSEFKSSSNRPSSARDSNFRALDETPTPVVVTLDEALSERPREKNKLRDVMVKISFSGFKIECTKPRFVLDLRGKQQESDRSRIFSFVTDVQLDVGLDMHEVTQLSFNVEVSKTHFHFLAAPSTFSCLSSLFSQYSSAFARMEAESLKYKQALEEDPAVREYMDVARAKLAQRREEMKNIKAGELLAAVEEFRASGTANDTAGPAGKATDKKPNLKDTAVELEKISKGFGVEMRLDFDNIDLVVLFEPKFNLDYGSSHHKKTDPVVSLGLDGEAGEQDGNLSMLQPRSGLHTDVILRSDSGYTAFVLTQRSVRMWATYMPPRIAQEEREAGESAVPEAVQPYNTVLFELVTLHLEVAFVPCVMEADLLDDKAMENLRKRLSMPTKEISTWPSSVRHPAHPRNMKEKFAPKFMSKVHNHFTLARTWIGIEGTVPLALGNAQLVDAYENLHAPRTVQEKKQISLATTAEVAAPLLCLDPFLVQHVAALTAALVYSANLRSNSDDGKIVGPTPSSSVPVATATADRNVPKPAHPGDHRTGQNNEEDEEETQISSSSFDINAFVNLSVSEGALSLYKLQSEEDLLFEEDPEAYQRFKAEIAARERYEHEVMENKLGYLAVGAAGGAERAAAARQEKKRVVLDQFKPVLLPIPGASGTLRVQLNALGRPADDKDAQLFFFLELPDVTLEPDAMLFVTQVVDEQVDVALKLRDMPLEAGFGAPASASASPVGEEPVLQNKSDAAVSFSALPANQQPEEARLRALQQSQFTLAVSVKVRPATLCLNCSPVGGANPRSKLIFSLRNTKETNNSSISPVHIILTRGHLKKAPGLPAAYQEQPFWAVSASLPHLSLEWRGSYALSLLRVQKLQAMMGMSDVLRADGVPVRTVFCHLGKLALSFDLKEVGNMLVFLDCWSASFSQVPSFKAQGVAGAFAREDTGSESTQVRVAKHSEPHVSERVPSRAFQALPSQLLSFSIQRIQAELDLSCVSLLGCKYSLDIKEVSARVADSGRSITCPAAAQFLVCCRIRDAQTLESKLASSLDLLSDKTLTVDFKSQGVELTFSRSSKRPDRPPLAVKLRPEKRMEASDTVNSSSGFERFASYAQQKLGNDQKQVQVNTIEAGPETKGTVLLSPPGGLDKYSPSKSSRSVFNLVVAPFKLSVLQQSHTLVEIDTHEKAPQERGSTKKGTALSAHALSVPSMPMRFTFSDEWFRQQPQEKADADEASSLQLVDKTDKEIRWRVNLDLCFGEKLIVTLSRSAIGSLIVIVDAFFKKFEELMSAVKEIRHELDSNLVHKQDPNTFSLSALPADDLVQEVPANPLSIAQTKWPVRIVISAHTMKLILQSGEDGGEADGPKKDLLRFDVIDLYLTLERSTGLGMFDEKCLIRDLTIQISQHEKEPYPNAEGYRWVLANKSSPSYEDYSEAKLAIFGPGPSLRAESIMEFPQFVLDMHTEEPLEGGTDIGYDFSMHWDKEIQVTSDVRLYQTLAATVSSVNSSISKGYAEVAAAAKTAAQNNARVGSRQKAIVVSQVTEEKEKAVESLPLKKMSDKQDQMTKFNINNPQISVSPLRGGGISIRTVLNQMGYSDSIQTLFTNGTHSGVTVGLDSLASVISGISLSLDKTFQDY